MLNYQEALLPGREEPGERKCGARWELIEPWAPTAGMVLDVGSNLGYFALRCAQKGNAVGVVSLESGERIAKRQREILASHLCHRVCLIRGGMDVETAMTWAGTCDWFDLTLLLSVLHWVDDPAGVVRALSTMSARLVAEVPDARDAGACGQQHLRLWSQPLEWFRHVTGRECTHLGRAQRHTSPHPSHIILIHGPVHRTPTLPYWGSRFVHPKGNDYDLRYDGRILSFAIRGRIVDYMPGINLLSLMHLGRLMWPKKRYWMEAGIDIHRAGDHHSDPLPHNMIWTPAGLSLIDADDLKGDVHGAGAQRMYRKYIRRWIANKTAHSGSYVPLIPQWRRVMRRWLRKSRRLPHALMMRLKRVSWGRR